MRIKNFSPAWRAEYHAVVPITSIPALARFQSNVLLLNGWQEQQRFLGPACPHGGVNAKTIVTVVHDPDQHRPLCAGARKHGANEPRAVEGGDPPHHAWDDCWPTTESPSSAIVQPPDRQWDIICRGRWRRRRAPYCEGWFQRPRCRNDFHHPPSRRSHGGPGYADVGRVGQPADQANQCLWPSQDGRPG